MVLITWILILLFISYVVASLWIFMYLKFKLQEAQLDQFKKQLGNNYKFRLNTKGWLRYKWSFGTIVIKASFDENGQLKEYDMRPCRFLPLSFKKCRQLVSFLPFFIKP